MANLGHFIWQPPKYSPQTPKMPPLGDGNNRAKGTPSQDYTVPGEKAAIEGLQNALRDAFTIMTAGLEVPDQAQYEKGCDMYRKSILDFVSSAPAGIELLSVTPLRTNPTYPNKIEYAAITYSISGTYGKQFRSSSSHVGYSFLKEVLDQAKKDE